MALYNTKHVHTLVLYFWYVIWLQTVDPVLVHGRKPRIQGSASCTSKEAINTL